MKVRISFGQTMFVSLVVSLLFCNAYAEEPIGKEPIGEEPIGKEPISKEPISKEPIEPKICADDYASVGRTVCDDHAECLEGDGAIACKCKEGALGDGWAISSGCVSVEGSPEGHPGVRERRWWIWGMWSRNQEIKPCSGRMALLGQMVCDRNAYCMQGNSDVLSIKCFCKKGSGNGFRSSFSPTSGCH
ncbi:uncharacterized protein [Pocillopora verrucosa]|uniref:uncharacterized protein n=1 Tax=Pocillopora verrucosa TaxID=203993 RepID=UPI00334000DF